MNKLVISLILCLLVCPIVHVSANKNVIPDGQEHPYLFFSKEDLPEIRKRLTREPFLTRWKVFLNNADEVVSIPAHSLEPYEEWTGPRPHLANAGKTAFAYIITGDKKYARRAIDEALIMTDGLLPDGSGGKGWYNHKAREWNKGADLNTAETAYALAMVYDWCYHQLSEIEKTKIKNAIVEKGLKQYLNSIERENTDFWVGNPVSNWAGVVNGGMGLGALAIYHESEIARTSVKYARKYNSEFLDHVFLKDGGGHEGVMYARYGQLFALYFCMADQRLIGPDFEFLRKFNQKLAGYWDVYMQAPDLKYANFNNIGEHTFQGLWGLDYQILGGPNSDINALMENFAGGDPLLLWAADNGAPRSYWDGASLWYFLWRRGEPGPVSVMKKPELQDAVLFRGAGHAIFQSDKLWLAYNGGWISNRSHHNFDLGSFILVLEDERMVNDPGYGDIDTRWHSTVTINNENQHPAQSGEFLQFGSGKNFHYLASDLTNAYNPEYLEKYIRHLLMVNGSYLVILDDLSVKNGAEVEWRLQTRNGVEIYDNQHAVIDGKQHKLFVIHSGDKVKTEITPWEGKNGKLNAISKTPTLDGQEHIFVTVLFPADKNLVLDKLPEVEFSDGLITITDGKNINEKVLFKNKAGNWNLYAVNSEDNLSFSNGSKRTINPFREMKKEIDENNFPSWFFSIDKN